MHLLEGKELRIFSQYCEIENDFRCVIFSLLSDISASLYL